LQNSQSFGWWCVNIHHSHVKHDTKSFINYCFENTFQVQTKKRAWFSRYSAFHGAHAHQDSLSHPLFLFLPSSFQRIWNDDVFRSLSWKKMRWANIDPSVCLTIKWKGIVSDTGWFHEIRNLYKLWKCMRMYLADWFGEWNGAVAESGVRAGRNKIEKKCGCRKS